MEIMESKMQIERAQMGHRTIFKVQLPRDSILTKLDEDKIHSFIVASSNKGELYLFNRIKGKIKNITINKNSPIYDTKVSRGNAFLCSDNQAAIVDLEKGIKTNICYHQQPTLFIAPHPCSPLAISVSNFLILSDLRSKSPSNISYLTSDPLSLQYSADGRQYVVGGSPGRVGNWQWISTLDNGTASFTPNCKYIIQTYNKQLSMISWREQKRVFKFSSPSNYFEFQPAFNLIHNQSQSGIVSLTQDGYLQIFNIGGLVQTLKVQSQSRLQVCGLQSSVWLLNKNYANNIDLK